MSQKTHPICKTVRFTEAEWSRLEPWLLRNAPLHKTGLPSESAGLNRLVMFGLKMINTSPAALAAAVAEEQRRAAE